MTTRPTTVQRGYGPTHQKLRARIKREVIDPGYGYCWRCTGHIAPEEPWDLGHDDHDRTVYRGPEHTRCNRATGGRRDDGSTPRRWSL